MIETTARVRVITSERLSLKQVGMLHSEFDLPLDKDFRKGSTFYANAFVEIDEEIADFMLAEYEIDIRDQIGMGYGLSGMWSDDDGCDWYSCDFYDFTEVYIPEEVKIIPARIEKKWVAYVG